MKTDKKIIEMLNDVHDIINSYRHIPAIFKACELLQEAIKEVRHD